MPRRSLPERHDLVKLPIRPENDLSGRTDLGEWTILEYAGTKNGHWFKCCCSCGNIGVVHGGELRLGRSTSCGHNGSTFKHGGAKRLRKTAEYNTWVTLRNRCNNPRCKAYKDYGGRGIFVCERWNTFENFLADMGPRPSPKHSIDRFPNNDGPYSPENCRWATVAEQRRNSRRIILITRDGVTLCAKDWCFRLGISYAAVYQRAAKKKISFEEAIFGKEGKTKP